MKIMSCNSNLCTVVKQTDVPTWTKSVQKLHQSPWPLGEYKPTKKLVFYISSATHLIIDTGFW
ncbi:hypothetical protein Hanom_Chr00s005412g01728891 [Helianthus anomalus]